MTNLLQAWSNVDPRELAINKRYKRSQYVPASVKAAQQQLADDIGSVIPTNYQPCRDDCSVHLVFYYPDNRSDIDGPVKRSLDALQAALRAAGHPDWNDRFITSLSISKRIVNDRTYPAPCIGISLL